MKKLEETTKEKIQILKPEEIYNLEKSYQRYLRRLEETRRYTTFKE